MIPAPARVSAGLAALAVTLAVAGSIRAAAEATPPVNTSPPTISGTLQQSQALTVASAWDGAAPIEYAYQWQRCNSSGSSCVGIGGATAQSYFLVAADVSATIRVVVTATNTAGTTSALSDATAVVRAPPAAPTERVPPSLTGAALAGSTLTVGPGTWSGDPPFAYTYQWQRCTLSGSCQDIVGATGSSYAATATDSGKQLRVKVTATNNISSNQALSNLSNIVTGGPNAPSSTTMPVITGFAQVGQTLTVSSGAWTGAPPFTFLYQWQRCDTSGSTCTNIPGATDRAYILVAADSGRRLGVFVTALVAAGAGRTRSNLSELVGGGRMPPANARLPAITGTAEVGQTLAVGNDTWTGTLPLVYTYRWQRCSQSSSCENIPAATGRTYRLEPADLRATLQVIVTVVNAFGSDSATSGRSAVVAAAGASGAVVLGNGLTSVPASSLFPPNRLVVDRVQLSPALLRSRATITVSFRVRDLHGRVVRGALVQVIAIPFDVVAWATERATGEDGWATFRLRPTGKLQLQNGGSLVLFVRARKRGESALAGISNRRLVKIRVGRPPP